MQPEARVPRLFALDQNFPQPLIDAATRYFQDVELEPLWRIDRRLAVLDDWEVLLALSPGSRSRFSRQMS